MASLQKKGDSWHCQFAYKKKRWTWVLGKVDDAEAHATVKRQLFFPLVLPQLRMLPIGGASSAGFPAAGGGAAGLCVGSE